MIIKQFFVFVHPYFGKSGRIETVRVDIIGKRVWMKVSENMTNSRARHDFDTAAALPDLQLIREKITLPEKVRGIPYMVLVLLL